jgi:hypothetical protein
MEKFKCIKDYRQKTGYGSKVVLKKGEYYMVKPSVSDMFKDRWLIFEMDGLFAAVLEETFGKHLISIQEERKRKIKLIK